MISKGIKSSEAVFQAVIYPGEEGEDDSLKSPSSGAVDDVRITEHSGKLLSFFFLRMKLQRKLFSMQRFCLEKSEEDFVPCPILLPICQVVFMLSLTISRKSLITLLNCLNL